MFLPAFLVLSIADGTHITMFTYHHCDYAFVLSPARPPPWLPPHTCREHYSVQEFLDFSDLRLLHFTVLLGTTWMFRGDLDTRTTKQNDLCAAGRGEAKPGEQFQE